MCFFYLFLIYEVLYQTCTLREEKQNIPPPSPILLNATIL